MLNIGSSRVNRLFIGDREVTKLYHGSDLVFTSGIQFVADMWAYMLPWANQVTERLFSSNELPSSTKFTTNTKTNHIGLDLAPGDQAHWRGIHFSRDADTIRVEVDTDRSGKASMKLQGTVPSDFTTNRVYVNFSTGKDWYGFRSRLWINGTAVDTKTNGGAVTLSENIVREGTVSTTGHCIVRLGETQSDVTAKADGNDLTDFPKPTTKKEIGFVKAAMQLGVMLQTPIRESGLLVVPDQTQAIAIAIGGGGGSYYDTESHGEPGLSDAITIGAGSYPVTIGQAGANGTSKRRVGTNGTATVLKQLTLAGGAGALQPNGTGSRDNLTFTRAFPENVNITVNNIGRGGWCQEWMETDDDTGSFSYSYTYSNPQGGAIIPILTWKTEP